jgi:hypothetical protein
MSADGPRPPDPDRSAERGGRGRPGRVYSLFVGAAFVTLIVVVLFNTLGGADDTLLGAGGDRGLAAAQFAVPEVLGSVEGDANVFQDNCESSEIPCPRDSRRTPACAVEGPGIIRVCDLFDRPLAISFWFTRGADCLPAQDAVDRVAERYRGRVNFLSLNVGDDREDVREIVRDRGWRIPVGYDADGAVSNLYRVGGCPTVAFLYPGGIISGAAVGTDELTEERLRDAIGDLVRESRRRAARNR